MTGGSPRDVAEGIQEADWAPDGTTLLVVRDVKGKSRIEYPLGKILYETSGHVSYARLSPKGDRVAFLDHPFALDDAGTVAFIDLAGKKTTLTGKWASEGGLVWAPSGDEIWFTATEAGANRSLYARRRSPGKLRVVARVPGGLKLHDIAKNGKVLITRESPRVGILGMLQGDTRERDMSFLDYSFAADLSPDGRMLLFDEEGEAGGANYTVFIRKTDRSPVVRLGEGNAMALSPDAKWALSILPLPNSPFRLLPTGTGEHPELPLGGVSSEQAATWFPDSQQILFAGTEAGHGVRLYVQSIDGGKPRAITPEGITAALPGFAVSPDGKHVAAIGPDHKAALFPVDGGSFAARSRVSRRRSFRCASRRTAGPSTSGSAGRFPRASRGSTSSPESARSGRTCSPPTRPASSASPTSSSPPTRRATPTASPGCCRISLSWKGSSSLRAPPEHHPPDLRR